MPCLKNRETGYNPRVSILKTFIERISNMTHSPFQRMFLILALVLAASFAWADEERVIQVFVIKPGKLEKKPTESNVHPVMKNIEIDLPTDGEMKAAYETLNSMGIDRDHLPGDDQTLMMETFLFKVKRVLPGQAGDEVVKVNGVPVEKSTDDDLIKERQFLKNLKGIENFFEPFEFQLGLGGAFPLTNNLALSYHNPWSFSVGLGYRLSPQFSLILNLDGSTFDSGNDARTQGFSLGEGAMELLGKFRFASEGIRPYLFAGPAIAFTEFNYKYSNSSNYNSLSVSNYGNTNLSDQGHFAVVGGCGFEIPISTYHLFIQAEAIDDFIGSDVSNFATLDQPIIFLPIEVGIVFGR